ncbi:MAG: energy transducer TonB [Gemmatimonadota bacterium]
MRRALTISSALHLLVLVALVLSGGLLSRDPRYPPVYQVNLIAAPRDETLRRRRQPAPRVEREPEAQPETAPEPEPEILEEPEELVPEENAPPPEPDEAEPEPAPEGPETPVEEEPPEAENPTPDAGGNEAALDLTIEGRPFPFPGYLERLVNKIGRNWQRTANRREARALVYFRVERTGKVSGIEIEESSGDFLFDQAALRAVSDASPMPPLPDGYDSDYLGVYFDFNEETR